MASHSQLFHRFFMTNQTRVVSCIQQFYKLSAFIMHVVSLSNHVLVYFVFIFSCSMWSTSQVSVDISDTSLFSDAAAARSICDGFCARITSWAQPEYPVCVLRVRSSEFVCLDNTQLLIEREACLAIPSIDPKRPKYGR